MSNDTRHTDGPWIQHGRFIYAMHEWKGKQVNRFSVNVEPYISQGGSEEEALANARLIAAAPQLLEALQLLVPLRPRECDEYDRAMWAYALDSINKATGHKQP